MLRITELRLPLNHAEDELRPAVVARLGIDDAQLLNFTVFKRSYDARKKTAIVLIYTIDCELATPELEAHVFQRMSGRELDAEVVRLCVHLIQREGYTFPT